MLTERETYLLESIQKGDYKAFEELFISYYSSLCKYAYSFVRSAETAEDLVSDFFMKLWEQPDSAVISTNLRAYLFRSIHNICLNYVARNRRNFQQLDEETVNKLNSLIPLWMEGDQLDLLLTVELEEKIEEAIKTLPEACGKIFFMSRKEGLSHKAIAEKMNLSENTVKVQIYRALVKMREFLNEYLH